jgi:hypothetical protein
MVNKWSIRLLSDVLVSELEAKTTILKPKVLESTM